MQSLISYTTRSLILEGGASGHMAHPYDYTEFTLRDLKGLIRNLFLGRVEDVTEKIDGTNIQATVNTKGEVVFIRNNGDLNSERGGMTIEDMATKWASKPEVAKTFLTAGKIIQQVFTSIPVDFFNPDENTKIAVNCECVVAGKTNIIPYATDQVDFHNLWVYKKENDIWVKSEVTKKGLETIEKACEKIDNARLTPSILIKTTEKSNDLLVSYIKELDKIFKNAGCGERSTIDDWKRARFKAYCAEFDEWTQWVLDSPEGAEILFRRWFKGDKSTNIKEIKKMYPGKESVVDAVDRKEYKKWVSDVMEPLDSFFGRLGNDVIKQCDGIINAGLESEVIQQLRTDIEDVVKDIRSNGSVELNDKLTHHLNRLAALGNEINPIEGIVFRYKGKLMKCTGSFSSMNAVLGSIKFGR